MSVHTAPSAARTVPDDRFMVAKGLTVGRGLAFTVAGPLVVGDSDVLVPRPRDVRADPALREAVARAIAECVSSGLHPNFMREYLLLCGCDADDTEQAVERAYTDRVRAVMRRTA